MNSVYVQRKKCLDCDNTFYDDSYTRPIKRCPSCRVIRRRELIRKVQNSLYRKHRGIIKCQLCKNEIPVGSSRHLYCSLECSKKGRRLNQIQAVKRTRRKKGWSEYEIEHGKVIIPKQILKLLQTNKLVLISDLNKRWNRETIGTLIHQLRAKGHNIKLVYGYKLEKTNMQDL